MPTPVGTAVPYCSAARLFIYHDPDQVADLLRTGNDPRPSRLAMLDPAREVGASLLAVLLAASGELESSAMASSRYTPADLAALTGSGLGRLEKLTADLAFWALAQRRQPGSADPTRVPGAKLALEELERLRSGQSIFGLQETEDAGLPGIIWPVPDANKPGTAIYKAERLFGNHGQ